MTNCPKCNNGLESIEIDYQEHFTNRLSYCKDCNTFYHEAYCFTCEHESIAELNERDNKYLIRDLKGKIE